jgi:signal transduction histidine kinase
MSEKDTATPSSSAGALKPHEPRYPWFTTAGFVLATALLIIVTAMAYRETRRQISSSEWVIHSRDVLTALTDYSNVLKSASNATTDYYGTGNKGDLTNLASAENGTVAAIQHVRALTADNPKQQHLVADLDAANAHAFVVLHKIVALYDDGARGADGVKPLADESKKMSADLSKAFAAMNAEENSLLITRTTQQANEARTALRLQVGGGILAVLLMTGVLAVFLRESRVRLNAQRDLSKANAELEQRVLDRTAEIKHVNELLIAENAERVAADAEIRHLNSVLEQRVLDRTAQLEAANKELEAFSYSVSHDLRAPLRHIDGFSKILVEDYSARMDPDALHCVNRIQNAIRSMGLLVDDLLNLSRVSRKDVVPQSVSLGAVVKSALVDMEPDLEDRQIDWRIGPLPVVQGDSALLKQVFINLLSNAAKFTRQKNPAIIEIREQTIDGDSVFMVRDNGVGFDMKYADKLFGVFQRLHTSDAFEGTGVGLATVQRIIHKHGGRVWAESEPDRGATFYFTLTGQPALSPEIQAVGRKVIS